MKKLRLLTLVMLWTAGHCAAGPELVSIPSLDGRLKIPGYWFQADAPGRRPAVISLHGCGGTLDAQGRLGAARSREAGYFNAEKMHFLVPDSFTPRGLKSICSTANAYRTVHEEDRREDVFAAIQWLAAHPAVDKDRIALVGRSHGAQTVLSVLDATARFVQAQPLQPRAAVALYPGCSKFLQMWNYQISAPLLLMIGELDDWTPADRCVSLHERLTGRKTGQPFQIAVFPGSYHGFDGTDPVHKLDNVSTRLGTATVGGNPEAREKAHQLMFEFLSARLETPLVLTHEQRLRGHRYAVPPASGFARIDEVGAVPLGDKGRARYEHYLGLAAPKAFAITEKGGWYFSSANADAMRDAMERCEKAGVKCWLYAVDERVVWQAEVAARIDSTRLQPKP
ncbi:MAG TPA: prolyl oligopeptidase family serine peptidase [Burkholderiales bacterium]